MNRDDAKNLIAKLFPKIWTESAFSSPDPQSHINCYDVFNAIREVTEPPLSEKDFNNIADEIEK